MAAKMAAGSWRRAPNLQSSKYCANRSSSLSLIWLKTLPISAAWINLIYEHYTRIETKSLQKYYIVEFLLVLTSYFFYIIRPILLRVECEIEGVYVYRQLDTDIDTS